MSRFFPLLLFVFLAKTRPLAAQSDSVFFKIPTPVFSLDERVAEARQLLRAAFLMGNDAEATAWLDTLTQRLANDTLATTWPEERWLLNYWAGRYEHIFRDLDTFNTNYLWLQQQKAPPPTDSLMEVLDEVSARRSYQLFQQIAAAPLTAEQRAFAAMHLEYLLSPRPTSAQMERQDEQVLAFLDKFPQSRFRAYMRNYLFSGQLVKQSGSEVDLLLWLGRPDGRYGQNFGLQVGGSLGLAYRWNRFSLGGRLTLGWQKTRRDFEIPGQPVYQDSSAFLLAFGPEAGYTIFELDKLRLRTHVGINAALLAVTVPGEDDGHYWRNLGGIQGMFGLSLDWRHQQAMFGGEPLATERSLNGVRIFAGYQWCNFDRQSRIAMRGNVFVLGLGISFKGNKRVVIH